MDIANKMRKSVTKAMRKIENKTTEVLVVMKGFWNRKIAKKFIADRLKRQKSRRKYENPFEHVKFFDERLGNETYTVNVHMQVKPTASYKTAESKACLRN
ncbi:hypothetical protein DPMN_149878 [Dreissena polymorpha]|uniref:Uncharacterized protein n=1 Tax=Dreissena polymorpha TaxID=45954 RepID=A0A9D4J546_DREPO|nr:hypothetical protein DPMN_149878 [Dreissena polymorpha]